MLLLIVDSSLIRIIWSNSHTVTTNRAKRQVTRDISVYDQVKHLIKNVINFS